MLNLNRNVLPMVVLTVASLIAVNASAAPILTVESSTAQIRKGEAFKIYLQITAQEDMQIIDLKWIPPMGFGLKLDQENEKYPREMRIGSSYTFVFSGVPPPSVNFGHSPGADTREHKIFIFNVDYSTRRDGISEAHQQTVRVNTAFSVDGFSYLVWGMIGLMLGGTIKQLTRLHEEKTGLPSGKTLQVLRDHVAIIDLLSVAAIGFVVLLVFAREAIPTKGWYDSLALGVAVAILSDDQLLKRVGSLVPQIR